MLDLIRRDLGLPSRREWFERLATREPVTIPPGVIADHIHAARAEREAQIAAALGLEEEAEDEDAEGDDAGVVDSSALVDLVVKTERGADNLRCPLVTADRKLSRAPGLGVPLITV